MHLGLLIIPLQKGFSLAGGIRAMFPVEERRCGVGWAVCRLWIFLTKGIVGEPGFHDKMYRESRRRLRRPDGDSP
jgi:hypothetical protein